MPTPNEQLFVNKMKADGWEVHQNGFPDFLCVKDGKIIIVEVKATRRERLSQQQFTMMRLLQSLGIETYRWSPDGELSKELLKPKPIKPMKARGTDKRNKEVMKYDSNTKRARNAEIAFLRKLQPELSLEEIGKRYGISAERVRQIIAKEHRQIVRS